MVFHKPSPSSSRCPFSVNFTPFANGALDGSCAAIASRYLSTNGSRQARSHWPNSGPSEMLAIAKNLIRMAAPFSENSAATESRGLLRRSLVDSSRVFGSGAQLLDEFACRVRPSEVRLDIEQSRFLHGGRTRGHGGIGDQDRPVIQHKGVPERRLDADVGRDPGEEQVADPASFELRVEPGIRKAAVAALHDDQVAGLRRELIDDREVPGSLGHKL